jgi:hypothetical protein
MTDGLLVGEIAVRPAGGGIPDLVQAQHGVDLWDAFVRIGLGEDPGVQARRRPGTYAECWMPVRSGHVTAITSRERLLGLPGVESARVLLEPGEQSIAPQYSWSRSADLVVRGESPAEVLERIRHVEKVFELHTKSPDSAEV